MRTEPTTFSAEEYFATQLAPPTLQEDVESVRRFIQKQVSQGRNVVLVTSGGTTVPLELNVVRFLDNFSAGTRGATSAEYFLKSGYAVIFMHRQFSLQPFSRHYSHSTNPFLDFLEIDKESSTPLTANSNSAKEADKAHPPPHISVTPDKRQDLLEVLTQYKRVHTLELLHTLTFVTVNDYLWLLRAVSKELAIMKRKTIFYLAAAVSDFFLPRQKMSEHKIQSGKGSLHIEMDQVPKILKPLVDEWTPGGYIVSFKLETDQALLLPKARQALERYGHQAVIGNDLHRRKFEVVFVSRIKRRKDTPGPPSSNSNPPPNSLTPQLDSSISDPEAASEYQYREHWVKIPQDPSVPGLAAKEIEEDIVAELVRRHQEWIGEETIREGGP